MAKVEGEIVEEEELGAEEEARRRLALAQIRQYPDVALKMAARPVEEFDEELGDLVERMKRLMHDAHGIGLAANQVGVLRRIFVFAPAKDEVAAVANAKIVERSDETEVVEEGCLSIQGVLVPIERPASIVLVGKDERGNDVRHELEGIYARAAQHELDHLDGVLIINRTTPEARREALALLRPRIVIS
ncbi:MAG: peptide deformylase [Actinobacteria bacterium]|nr:MAG: peptide deformylase [Actinomycetota bacterium]